MFDKKDILESIIEDDRKFYQKKSEEKEASNLEEIAESLVETLDGPGVMELITLLFSSLTEKEKIKGQENES